MLTYFIRFKILWIISIFALSFTLGAQEVFDISDAPGELSPAHTEVPGLKQCSKCHSEELEVDPALCLACHQEISQRISAKRGYHQDKGDECAVCHMEHQGKEEPLVLLDPEDFDHEETGYKLQYAHKQVPDCRTCHREDRTIIRKNTRSYLFKQTGCQTCHTSPHPGRQEICLACHTQKDWRVDTWRMCDK